MKNHNRGYYRLERIKHIKRKKRIIHNINDYWHYKYEGELSKGKIHCSCKLCSSKTKDIGYKASDKCKLLNMKQELEDYAETSVNLL
jgi:hypothetical protein